MNYPYMQCIIMEDISHGKIKTIATVGVIPPYIDIVSKLKLSVDPNYSMLDTQFYEVLMALNNLENKKLENKNRTLSYLLKSAIGPISQLTAEATANYINGISCIILMRVIDKYGIDREDERYIVGQMNNMVDLLECRNPALYDIIKNQLIDYVSTGNIPEGFIDTIASVFIPYHAYKEMTIRYSFNKFSRCDFIYPGMISDLTYKQSSDEQKLVLDRIEEWNKDHSSSNTPSKQDKLNGGKNLKFKHKRKMKTRDNSFPWGMSKYFFKK